MKRIFLRVLLCLQLLKLSLVKIPLFFLVFLLRIQSKLSFVWLSRGFY
ncbi:hypothetical protein SAMN05421740_106256 [Parapedobacter koreensis]|uniref:Uncharacterized protein n=1 Tax=Parapedobacter koreensis TaxID=332977 RepID=A0A1H7R3Q0_9SPHI|nr:hypothetical protein SAMN05421740_106256 [Parapedobacter koreensis]